MDCQRIAQWIKKRSRDHLKNQENRYDDFQIEKCSGRSLKESID